MRAIGIILAGGNNHRMKELTQKRASSAMPVAGSYRSIDFALSSMSNSHIQKVAVLTQYNSRSLNEHLSSSKWWDFGRKQGGLYVLTPAVTADNSNWYRGTADAIYQNIHFLKNSHEPYVIIASGDGVYKMDFGKLLEYHINKKADITVVCRDMEEDINVERFGTIKMNEECRIEEFEEKQHFTQPPAHYTEASLVRELEELGIGRPSTYAPTITTIMARHYVVKENKTLFVTELGEVVNNMMQEAFPAIVDVNFTANLETLLDGVGEGKVNWKTVVSNFYPDLDEAVKKAEQDLAKVQIADEESDEVCEHCGRKMVIKYGPHGKFLACPGFPECRNTKPYFEKIGVACPKCGKDIVIKKTKKGRKYYGCIGNPDCDFMVWQKPSGEKCPRCGKLLLEKGNKLVCMDEQCGYVKNKPTEEK